MSVHDEDEKQEHLDTLVLNQRLAGLLRNIAIALYGPEPDLVAWDWSQLPKRVKALADAAHGLTCTMDYYDALRNDPERTPDAEELAKGAAWRRLVDALHFSEVEEAKAQARGEV